MLKPVTVVVAGLVGMLSPIQFAGAETPHIPLIVRVSNNFGLLQHQLKTARQTAQAIFRHSDIEAEWRECPAGRNERLVPTGCTDPLKPTEVVVRIMATPSATQLPDDVLGFSYINKLGAANGLATVFADAVARIAARTYVEPGTLLGRALAHEVGHLLLGTTAHPTTGIMRANWTGTQLQRLDWSFSPTERRQMQQALEARLKFDALRAVLAQLTP